MTEQLSKEEVLIASVKENKFLYDKTLEHYQNNEMKVQKWEEIGKKIACSGDEAKKQWESLRAQFVAYMRKSKQPTGSGRQTFFRHGERMRFVADFVQPRKSRLLDSEEFEEEDTTEKKIFIIDESTLLSTDSSVDLLPPCSIPDNPKRLTSKKRRLDPIAIDDFSSETTDEQRDNNESNKEEDEFDHFSKALAVKLRRLHRKCPKTCAETELKIHQLLFEAQFS